MKSKFLKIIVTTAMMSSIFISLIGSNNMSTYANEVNAYEIKVEAINLNGEDVNLYKQFKNSNLALEKFKADNSAGLRIIKESNGLDELNKNNYMDYYEKALEFNISDVGPEIKESINKMIQFFDIYENEEKNIEISNFKKNLNTRNLTEENMEDLYLMLPYTSTEEWERPDVYATIGINQTNAINYARKYARNPNTSQYGYLGGNDCTNFVSQILVAGGIRQVYGSNQNSGWWHRKIVAAPASYDRHEYSISWQRADTFAKYMGVSYKTTNHQSFSQKLSKADIIGMDNSKDGDWDHLGFIVNKNSTLGTYGNKKYYNYEVAQHSKNYVAWTNSSENGWENAEGASSYGILRK